MQSSSPIPGLQMAPLAGMPTWLSAVLHWLWVFGEPGFTSNELPIPGLARGLAGFFRSLSFFGEFGLTEHEIGVIFGSAITWLKVVGLFALIGWSLSWVLATFRARDRARVDGLDVAALVALGGCLLAIVLNVLISSKQVRNLAVGGLGLPALIALACGAVILAWTERSLWTSIRRFGRGSDLAVLAGLHLAIPAGMGVAALMSRGGGAAPMAISLQYTLLEGVRLGATYMGYVVLVKVLLTLLPELVAMRGRRLFAIARQSITEAFRRMWAPWVVLVLFGVILAFTHWFLPASQQRSAELGRIYVGTLSLLCMLLLTVMVTILAPLSLPQDIQMQTIYTVVSKPVRRMELILGRIIGYMTIVTALTVIFGGISLVYLWRNIGGEINSLTDQAVKIERTDPDRFRVLNEAADQMRTRMSARLPVKGSLTFVDSRGTPQIKGIDVGQELEFRSHIEGATEAAAIWTYGASVVDPLDPKLRLNRRIPVDSLLKAGTIEAVEDQKAILQYGANAIERQSQSAGLSAADQARAATESTQAKEQIRRLDGESKKLQDRYKDLIARADAADAAKKSDDAANLRDEAAALHSPPIRMEMTFTIYRTTKGRVGEPVYAEVEVENPRTGLKYKNTFPIREYYTNKKSFASSYLVGSLGDLRITVRCKSPTQYLGMAESDFYLLADEGTFGVNFFKGLFGIWLQAAVLTTIGVFAGTFLSWPVALLFTIAFFVAGHAAFAVLRDFFLSTVQGGGPFESLIRLLTHDNQMSDLAATPGVVVAKTLDAVVMPVMSRMVYLIPNLSSLDVTNTVAEGFAVTWLVVIQNALISLAYVIPFSIFGYFILKNREVAA